MILDHYKSIIQEKQKTQKFSSFIRDICSWYPLRMYDWVAGIGIYPGNDRHAPTISADIFEESRESITSRDIDHEKDFFDQFAELFRSISLPGFHHYYGVENSTYSNHVSSTSHAYSSFHVTGDCERVMYSLSTKIYAKNIYNSTMSWMQSENVYQSLGTIRSMNVYYSKYIQDSHDIWFSSDLIGCSECIFCHDQANISYAINNIVYAKEVYEEKKKEILKEKSRYPEYYSKLPSLGKSRGSERVTGKYCNQSEDVEQGYYSIHVKNGKNILFTGHPDGLSDCYNSLFVSAGLGYYGACGVGGDSEEIYNSVSIMRSFECYYSYFLERCSFCFWCIGLKNKSYCIFNKQYEKEDWYKEVNRIFEKMQEDWTLWDFFPARICPFYFEDSLAGMMMKSISQTSLEKQGFLVSSLQSAKKNGMTNIISSETLPEYEGFRDGEWYIDERILDLVIEDSEGKYFTIQAMEREFLIRHALPLPRMHWMERMMINIS